MIRLAGCSVRFSWRTLLQRALVTCAWLVVLGLGMGSVLRRLAAPSWGNAMAETNSPEISRGTVAGQSFRAPLPGLSGIEVPVSAVVSALSRHVTLRLFDEGKERIAEETFNLDPGVSTAALRLELAPISNSQGRTFRFTVESDAPAGEGVRAGYSQLSMLEGAASFLDGRTIEGNLQFQTYYTPSAWQKAWLVLSRLAEGGCSPIRTRGFFVGAALVFAACLALFTWQVVLTAAAGEGDRS